MRQSGIHKKFTSSAAETQNILATQCFCSSTTFISGRRVRQFSPPLKIFEQAGAWFAVLSTLCLIRLTTTQPFSTQKIIVLALGTTTQSTSGTRWC